MSYILPELVTVAFPDDPLKYIAVQPQKQPDLPFANQCLWGHLHLIVLYYFTYNNLTDNPKLYLVEFINDNWYSLEWSTRANQYYLSKDKKLNLLAAEQHNLSFWHEADPFHPDNWAVTIAKYTQTQEPPAEWSSTPEITEGAYKSLEYQNLPEQSTVIKQTPQILPPAIQNITNIFEGAPVFDDIAEPADHEPAQPQEHYLPITMAELTSDKVNKGLRKFKAQELSLNPPAPQMPDEDNVLPPHQPLPNPLQVTDADKIDTGGKLDGTPPAFFEGDQTKSQDFLWEFMLYWMQNNQHPKFTNPYYWVVTCLAWIWGPNMNDWVANTMHRIREDLEQGNVSWNNKQLWGTFKAAFEVAFIDLATIEKAISLLAVLELKGEDMDIYIAKFNSLMRKVGYSPTDARVLKQFCDRFPQWLTACIISQDHWPISLEEWQSAVHQEIC